MCLCVGVCVCVYIYIAEAEEKGWRNFLVKPLTVVKFDSYKIVILI
jgi:hypothetical protein